MVRTSVEHSTTVNHNTSSVCDSTSRSDANCYVRTYSPAHVTVCTVSEDHWVVLYSYFLGGGHRPCRSEVRSSYYSSQGQYSVQCPEPESATTIQYYCIVCCSVRVECSVLLLKANHDRVARARSDCCKGGVVVEPRFVCLYCTVLTYQVPTPVICFVFYFICYIP